MRSSGTVSIVPPSAPGSEDSEAAFAAAASAVVLQAPVSIGIYDSRLRPRFLNCAGRRMIGLSAAADITACRIGDCFTARERRLVESVGLPALLRQGSWDAELSLRPFTDPSRQIRVRWSAFTLRDAAGGLIGAAAFTTDISAGEPAGRPVRDESGLHPADLHRVRDAIAACIGPAGGGGYTIEYRVIGRDDSVTRRIATGGRTTVGQGSPLDLLGAPSGVTAQHRTEAAIRASEAQFSSFAAHSSNLIWIADAAAGTIIYRSAVFDRIWGEPRATAPASLAGWMEAVHPEDRPQVERAVATVRAGEVAQCEYRLIRPGDGTIRWLRDTSFPILGEDGAVSRIGGITEDLTPDDRRQVYVVCAQATVARRLMSLVRAVGYRARIFESAAAFLDIAAVLAPGCVLVDLRGSRQPGLSVPRELRARSIALPAILLDGPAADVASAVTAMKAGATDYLAVTDEDSLGNTLANAVADCHAAARPATRDESAAARVVRLTPREREVLLHLVSGGTNKTIGQALGISPRTVELHRAQVMNRLNASNLTELLQTALAAGIAPDAGAGRRNRKPVPAPV